MSELASRAKLEDKLAAAIARLEGRHKRELLDKLGDPPKLENIPTEWWNDASREWRDLLTPELEKIYLESAQAMLAETSIGVDWALVNKAAAEWAQKYSYELVKGITDNTRDALRAKIGGYFEQQMTMGQLRDSIGQLFGPIRAQAISVTEVTRASVNGELSVVNLIEADTDLRMVAIFQTSADDLVCPYCAPLNGKKVDPDKYPPLHVNCRCWLNHELLKGKRG